MKKDIFKSIFFGGLLTNGILFISCFVSTPEKDIKWLHPVLLFCGIFSIVIYEFLKIIDNYKGE